MAISQIVSAIFRAPLALAAKNLIFSSQAISGRRQSSANQNDSKAILVCFAGRLRGNFSEVAKSPLSLPCDTLV